MTHTDSRTAAQLTSCSPLTRRHALCSLCVCGCRWTDWNGICFQVSSSTNSPAGTTNWIVYPNDFPTQQVELYYDLPTYNSTTTTRQTRR